jgi:hypothetical protein
MRTFGRYLTVGGLMLLVTGCGEDVLCPQWDNAAVSVHVTSAVDASPILAARGAVQAGAYRDSLQLIGDGYYEAGARGGTYAVSVESDGFERWDTTGIQASESGGKCRLVLTAALEARLAPLLQE